ncbi:MAG: CPBP family intramembrane metalloprotease [Frankiaceae bacterium]|jgi:membrane protease YdiL (CAAX protease family)|nr:CPBP family intramembrane metalloprotease [Frankiaceae bacterium]
MSKSAAPGQFRPPPGWPPPPPRWAPPPGWAPDPRWPPPPPGWQWFDSAPATRWALDAAVREAKRRAGPAWGQGAAWWPVLGLVVVLLASGAAAAAASPPAPWGAVSDAARAGVFYAVLAVLGMRAGRRAARAGGGWAATFGVGRPRWLDLPLGLVGAAGEYAGQFGAAILLAVAVPWLRNADASNLRLDGLSGVELAISAIPVVLFAPVVEEFLFRGLMLRTLVARMGFWPAALLSSAVFAILHAPGVDTLRGAVLLVTIIFVFAIGQCLLVRWRATLGPAVVAHATSNAIAFGLSALAG